MMAARGDLPGTEPPGGAASLPRLFAHAPAGLLRLDPAWRIVEANAAFLSMLGGALPSAAGAELPTLLEDPAASRAMLDSLREGGQGFVAEWAIRRDGAEPLAARFTLAPLLPAGALALVEDLSPREADRLRLRDALRLTQATERSARLGGWEIDEDRRALTWTNGMRAIHEVPPGFAPTPSEALAFIVPDSRDAVKAAFLACARTGAVLDIEAEIVTARGSRRRVHITGEAQRDASGRIRSIAGAFQDVTGERPAQLAVRELTERLAATLDSIGDAFLTLDPAMRLTHANYRAVALLGLGAGTPPFLPGGVLEEKLRAALRSGAAATFEAPLPGTGRWLEVRAYPAASGLTVVLHDVTERRREAERLRLLEACVARVNDILLITEAGPIEEPGPRIVFANDAFRRITGHAPEEVLGRSPRMLQGPGTQRAELDRIRAALAAKQPVRAELINYTRSGEEIWLELDIVPVASPSGETTHLVAVQRDVTERKRAQARIEQQAALLDQVGDSIVVRDMAERVIYWNRAAERMYGWTAAEAMGRGVRGLVYESEDAIDGPMRALMAQGSWSGRFAQRRKDGSRLTVDANWRLMRDEAGTPTAVLAVSTDVTDRLVLEERLRRSHRLEAVGQLTGGIAHDFNNLLTVILGNAELLIESLAGTPELRELAEFSADAAERGAALTTRLLAFSRQQALDPKVVELDALLAGLAPCCAGRWGSACRSASKARPGSGPRADRPAAARDRRSTTYCPSRPPVPPLPPAPGPRPLTRPLHARSGRPPPPPHPPPPPPQAWTRRLWAGATAGGSVPSPVTAPAPGCSLAVAALHRAHTSPRLE
jgi:PAS domain S-box-containing protein